MSDVLVAAAGKYRLILVLINQVLLIIPLSSYNSDRKLRGSRQVFWWVHPCMMSLIKVHQSGWLDAGFMYYFMYYYPQRNKFPVSKVR